ncbi:MAG: hypothetical protein S0880_31225 [Actinomycetota bacterium]|nr:hypothetical protein [Actinomycetota bacterium]
MSTGASEGPRAVDERRHDDGVDVFTFLAGTPGATFGLHVDVVTLPALGTAWYWAAVIEEGRPLVTLLETETPLPRRDHDLELRTSGLWADHVCETPLVHWSLGLEAFAVGLDDPTGAWGDFRGDRVPLGFDLEWEHDDGGYSAAPGHDVFWSLVTGEVLVGREAYDLTAHGWRGHRWGGAVPWTGPGATIAAVVDGEPVHAGDGVAGVASDTTGVRWRPGAGLDSLDGVVHRGEPLPVEVIGWSPVRVPNDGFDLRIARAFCRFGDRGNGWIELVGV